MKVLITLLAVVIAGIIMTLLVLYIVRRVQSKIMRRRIANEGFETASDILYPNKRRTFKKYRMTPVLPG